jgi:transcription elongation factor Elf1
MPDDVSEAIEIKETDIVFNCPHCTKSLAIDYRGAGLFIVCPDCNSRVQVPIPEGMEVSDIDSTAEEQAIRIVHLRESLAEAQRRVEEMESEVLDLKQRREKLEKFRMESTRLFEDLIEELPAAEKSLSRLSDLVRRAAEVFKEK